jgi:hypothetical protein
MTLIEAAKQSLDAWDAYSNASDSQEDARAYAMMSVAAGKLRTAIEQAEKQEPVAQGSIQHLKLMMEHSAWDGVIQLSDALANIDEFYTTPPAAQRQPLTDEEIDDIWNRYCDEMGEASINDAYDIARAIEASHGIKDGT